MNAKQRKAQRKAEQAQEAQQTTSAAQQDAEGVSSETTQKIAELAASAKAEAVQELAEMQAKIAAETAQVAAEVAQEKATEVSVETQKAAKATGQGKDELGQRIGSLSNLFWKALCANVGKPLTRDDLLALVVEMGAENKRETGVSVQTYIWDFAHYKKAKIEALGYTIWGVKAGKTHYITLDKQAEKAAQQAVEAA